MAQSNSDIEKLLSLRFRRKHAIMVGRGATGLVLIMRTLSDPGGRVLLPAIACPSILASCLIAERKPVIIDVDENLNIDPARVLEIIQENDVVIAIHIFGIPCEIERLREICSRKNAILVEDVAQAVGGELGDKMLGEFGTVSLLSFAGGKILTTSGGGAILVDDEEIAEKFRAEARELKSRPDDIVNRALAVRDELTSVFNLARNENPDIASKWSDVFLKYGDIYSYSMEPSEIAPISRAFDRLENIAESRRMKVESYKKVFSELPVKCLSYPEDCVPYRFTFICEGLSGSEVQIITGEIRSAGCQASNLYLPINYLAPDKIIDTGCPRAENAGLRVINLWVDESVGELDILIAADTVKNHFR